MSNLVHSLRVITRTAGASRALTRSMLGYINAGTAALIIQASIAFAVGIGVALKFYWRNILNFFKKEKKDEG